MPHVVTVTAGNKTSPPIAFSDAGTGSVNDFAHFYLLGEPLILAPLNSIDHQVFTPALRVVVSAVLRKYACAGRAIFENRPE